MKLFKFCISCLIFYPASLLWAQDLRVVATFSVLADMIRAIGGQHVAVQVLVGPNGDPHVYEPTPADSAALAGADLVFVNGLGLEGWMDRLIMASGYQGKIVVATDGIASRSLIDVGKQDPHAWTSVANGVIYATNIQQALMAAQPNYATDYKINGNRYITALQNLDTWIRHELSAIPPAQRKIITSHASFGYLGAAYGIEFYAPVGFSTASDPSAKQVAMLIEQIRHVGIKAVFIENATDDRLIKQVARETGVQLGGILYAESLSNDDGPASSYIKMMQYNIKTITASMLHH